MKKIVFLIFISIAGCSEDKENGSLPGTFGDLPNAIVTVRNITSTRATFYSFTDPVLDGPFPFIMGYCYATTLYPTIDNYLTYTVLIDRVNSWGNIINIEITDATPNTQYYVRIYQKKGDKILYGGNIGFKTLPE